MAVAKKYDKIQQDLMDYILSGQMHSTLIGKLVSMDSSSDPSSIKAVEELVEYIVSLLQRSENYGKDHVKSKSI
jgi:hypothetical protein